jgi:hypothetical protein
MEVDEQLLHATLWPYSGITKHQVPARGLECVVWNTVQWPTALASGGLSGFPELKQAADAVDEEVLSRTAPVVAQRMYAQAWRKTA